MAGMLGVREILQQGYKIIFRTVGERRSDGCLGHGGTSLSEYGAKADDKRRAKSRIMRLTINRDEPGAGDRTDSSNRL